jgi:hypothetical protein
MTKKIARAAHYLVFAVLLGAVAGAVAADKVDFSGSYTLKKTTEISKQEKGVVRTLHLSQSETAIEVTRVQDGHSYVNTFPLDGSTGKYVSPGGPTGTCKGEFKSKSLILDSYVTARARPDSPALEMHTRERWELSSDSKTLKIRTDVEFPQLTSTLNGFQVIEPWTETYTRD